VVIASLEQVSGRGAICMKKLIAGALIAGAIWTLWPYYSLYDLARSINQADPVGLERRIDWKDVRQGLREDFSAIFLRIVGNDKAGPGAALGSGLAAIMGPMLIEKAVEAYATPQAVTALIVQRKLRKLEDPSVKTTGPEPTQAPTKGGLHLDMLKYAFFSGSPFTFRVEIAPVTHNETPLTLLFKWNGDWRLVRIFLPAKAIEAVGSKVTEAGRSPSRDGDLSVSKSGSPPPAVAEKPSEQPKTPEAAPIWTIKESKSPIDDSRQIEGFFLQFRTANLY
jgi:Protein of unknown function (DUF2939)